MAKKVGFSVDPQSIREINSVLSEVPEKARKKLLGKSIRKAAKILRDEVKRVVPIGPMKRLKKGVKSRSIKKSRTKVGMVVKVEHPVAANLEFGTKHIEARGFMAEASKNKDEEVLRKIVEGLTELVAELNGK